MNISIEKIRHAMVDAAHDYVGQVIRDYQPGQQATPRKIEQIVFEAGAAWDLGDDQRYTDEAELEWCGYFIAACARRVGRFLEDGVCYDVALRPELAAEGMGSTYRLQADDHWEPYPVPAEVEPQSAKAGTILVIDTGGGQDDYGDHIALARGPVRGGEVPTIEGNASGVKLGDGTIGEGVGYTTREVDEIHRAQTLRVVHFGGADCPPDREHRDLETPVAEAEADDKVATTSDGEPCTRCADSDGYCHQHEEE